jgi:hypothetical protein
MPSVFEKLNMTRAREHRLTEQAKRREPRRSVKPRALKGTTRR